MIGFTWRVQRSALPPSSSAQVFVCCDSVHSCRHILGKDGRQVVAVRHYWLPMRGEERTKHRRLSPTVGSGRLRQRGAPELQTEGTSEKVQIAPKAGSLQHLHTPQSRKDGRNNQIYRRSTSSRRRRPHISPQLNFS